MSGLVCRVRRVFVSSWRVRYHASSCLFCRGGATADRTMGKIPARKSGTMMKRAVAEQRIADELNLYAKQLSGGDQEMIYTATIVHNSSKLRRIHQSWRRSTSIILADQEKVFF